MKTGLAQPKKCRKEGIMFGANKRMFLALMIGFLASSWGCSTLIAKSGVYSAAELDTPQTRAEVRERFGEADETRTCPGGLLVEYRWIRQKIDWICVEGLRNPKGMGCSLLAGAYQGSYGLIDIFVFPVVAYQSEQAKLHYAFVYDEGGRVLYLYNLKVLPHDQFEKAVNPLAKELCTQLAEGKCATWSICVAKYVKEARQRADCIGYALDAEEEREFEDLLTIGEWVDSGQVLSGEGLADIKEMPHRRFWFLD
jgi:hypothetical protein